MNRVAIEQPLIYRLVGTIYVYSRLYNWLEFRHLKKCLQYNISPRDEVLELVDLEAAEQHADACLRARGYSHPELVWGLSIWNNYRSQDMIHQYMMIWWRHFWSGLKKGCVDKYATSQSKNHRRFER